MTKGKKIAIGVGLGLGVLYYVGRQTHGMVRGADNKPLITGASASDNIKLGWNVVSTKLSRMLGMSPKPVGDDALA